MFGVRDGKLGWSLTMTSQNELWRMKKLYGYDIAKLPLNMIPVSPTSLKYVSSSVTREKFFMV